MNYFELKLKSISENEKFARNLVAGFVIPLNPTVSELDDVKTAVSEAVTNCVVHGYNYDEGKEIFMRCEIDNSEITITISDNGVGIDNINEAMQPFFTTKSCDDRSGMGFTIMQSFMDTVNVFSRKDEGTTIVMKKKINSNIETEVINA